MGFFVKSDVFKTVFYFDMTCATTVDVTLASINPLLFIIKF